MRSSNDGPESRDDGFSFVVLVMATATLAVASIWLVPGAFAATPAKTASTNTRLGIKSSRPNAGSFFTALFQRGVQNESK